MDEISSKRTVITRKSPGLGLRESSESPRGRNVQVCSRASCSSKLNPSHSHFGSPSSSKAKASKTLFRPPGIGKEIIGTSSNTLRKPISDSKKSKLHSRNSGIISLQKEPETSKSESNNRLVKRNNLTNVRCNSVSDVASSSSSTESPMGKRRDMGKNRVGEPESCLSIRGKKNTGTMMDDKRSENSNRGISISDSRQARNVSPAVDNIRRSIARTRIGNTENGRRTPMIESPLRTPSPQPEMSRDSMVSSSGNRFSVNRSDSVNRSALRQYNLDGIAEMLLALERIEQEEDPSYEQLLVLETNLFLGGLAFNDQHRDMRLDIDNMSYEELLALEDRIGSVSTGIPEEDLMKCLKRTTFKCRENENDVKCSICQEEYGNGEKVGRLKCEHRYHIECINHWLRLKNWCPVCKAQVIPTSLS